MAGNYGKYKDRSPIICPAGKVSGDPNDTVASTLKQYRLVDEIDALKHDAAIWKEDQFRPPRQLPPIRNCNFKGTNTEISGLLRPATLTRYQQLVLDLKETPYCSYWNAQIGKCRDPTPGLPAGMNPIDTTYGEVTKKDTSVKELVNPPKGHYEVLRESQVGHDMYKKTHNDYNPSEKVDRGYLPPYNPDKCFGEKTKYDPRGVWVKCSCDWYKKGPVDYANKIQADYFRRTRPQIGTVLAPNDNIKCVPEGYSFGTASKQDFYGVEDLLKDPNVKPSVFKRDFHQWISSLNKLRILLKERRGQGLNLEQLFKRARFLDKENTGYLPLSDVYQLCACKHIVLPQEVKLLCDHLNYIEEGRMNYRKFIDLIDINKELVDVKPIDVLPPENKYYTSSSQAANCDFLSINNNDLPSAGIPSIRHDLPRPVAPPGGCRADIEHLGDETSAKAVVNPSIYTNFGLTYRDFFQPRPPELIRTLFEKLGYTFPGDNFQKLWQLGVDQDKTGLVCVDTFKRLLDNRCPLLKLRVDEKQIEYEKGIRTRQ